MSQRRIGITLAGALTLLPACGAAAQVRARANAFSGIDAQGNALTVEAALHAMADRSAIIFLGTVVEVRRTISADGSDGPVEIEFQVEQPVRGCSGPTYILKEWSGLWTASDARFTAGRRLLMLLHAPSAAGFSTPVGGMDGAIPVRASGSGVTASGSSNSVTESVADLRWLGARLVRPNVYAGVAGNGSMLVRSRAVSSASAASVSPTEPGSSSVPAQEVAISAVVGLLRGWEGNGDAAR